MSIDSKIIESHLEKILASAEFARSERMARFLLFVVHHARSGNPEALKERAIGMAVFDRPKDWDPKLDTIVRSEARRLREKLESYYESGGKSDKIRITIPKGGYSPRFDSQPAGELPRAFFPISVLRRLVLLLTVLLIVITVLSIGLSRKRKSVEAKEYNFDLVPFATEFGPEFSPVISPNGKQIAYVWNGNAANFDIYIKNIGGGQSHRFTTDSAPDLDPAWSPDGNAIAFLRLSTKATQLIVKDLAEKHERIVAQVMVSQGSWTDGYMTGDGGPAWLPDGKHIVVTDSAGPERGYGLHLIAVNGGEQKFLTSPSGEIHDFYPRVSPDGRTIAFVRYSSHSKGEIFIMPAAGGGARQVTFDGRVIRGLSWLPDGTGLVFASNRMGSFQLWTLNRSTDSIKLIPANTTSAADPSVARTGDWLAFSEIRENWNIWRARLTEHRLIDPERFISSTGRNHTPRYSPDGSKIAFVSDRSGNWEIWACDADGTNLRQLTHFRGPWLGGLTWSPDGKFLAFDARPQQHSAIFIMPASGGQPKLLEQNNYEERMPSWSKDGKSIYFDSNRSGTVAIWKRSLSTGTATQISRGPGFASEEIGDGELIYSDPTGAALWKVQPNRGIATILASNLRSDASASWAVGSKGLYVASDTSPFASFLMYRFSNRRTLSLGSVARPIPISAANLAVSPDGKWLLYPQQEYTSGVIYIRQGSLPSSK